MTAGQGAEKFICGKCSKHPESAGYTRIRGFVNPARNLEPGLNS
jgi:hypothetical protein